MNDLNKHANNVCAVFAGVNLWYAFEQRLMGCDHNAFVFGCLASVFAVWPICTHFLSLLVVKAVRQPETSKE